MKGLCQGIHNYMPKPSARPLALDVRCIWPCFLGDLIVDDHLFLGDNPIVEWCTWKNSYSNNKSKEVSFVECWSCWSTETLTLPEPLAGSTAPPVTSTDVSSIEAAKDGFRRAVRSCTATDPGWPARGKWGAVQRTQTADDLDRPGKRTKLWLW